MTNANNPHDWPDLLIANLRCAADREIVSSDWECTSDASGQIWVWPPIELDGRVSLDSALIGSGLVRAGLVVEHYDEETDQPYYRYEGEAST